MPDRQRGLEYAVISGSIQISDWLMLIELLEDMFLPSVNDVVSCLQIRKFYSDTLTLGTNPAQTGVYFAQVLCFSFVVSVSDFLFVVHTSHFPVYYSCHGSVECHFELVIHGGLLK